MNYNGSLAESQPVTERRLVGRDDGWQGQLPHYPSDPRDRPETVYKWPDRLPVWQYALLYFCSTIDPLHGRLNMGTGGATTPQARRLSPRARRGNGRPGNERFQHGIPRRPCR